MGAGSAAGKDNFSLTDSFQGALRNSMATSPAPRQRASLQINSPNRWAVGDTECPKALPP